MDTVYFYEDFGDLSYNLGNIFMDVDGDDLSYEKIDQDGVLYFTSQIDFNCRFNLNNFNSIIVLIFIYR